MLEDWLFDAPAFEVTKSYRDENGQMFIEGIASTTGVDLTEERMAPEAIAKMAVRLVGKPLREEHQKGYLNKLGEIVQADVMKDTEGKPALWIKARLYDWSSAARDTFSAIVSGVKLGLSVAGKVNPGGVVRQLVESLGKYVVTYIDVEPIEVSVTDHPANLDTFALAVAKSYEEKEKEEDETYAKAVTKASEEKPKEYKDVAEDDFLDPENHKYPADKKHLMPALKYFNHEGQREAGGYSPEKWAQMGRKLARKLTAETGEEYTYDSKTETVIKKEEVRKEVNEEMKTNLVSKKVSGEVADLVKQFNGNLDGTEVAKAEPPKEETPKEETPKEETPKEETPKTEVKEEVKEQPAAEPAKEEVKEQPKAEPAKEEAKEEAKAEVAKADAAAPASTDSKGSLETLLSDVMSTLSSIKSSVSTTTTEGDKAEGEEPSFEAACEALTRALDGMKKCWAKMQKGGASTPATTPASTPTSTPSSTDVSSVAKAVGKLTEAVAVFEKKVEEAEAKLNTPARKGFAIEKKFDGEEVKKAEKTVEDRVEVLKKDPEVTFKELHAYRDFGIVPKKYAEQWK